MTLMHDLPAMHAEDREPCVEIYVEQKYNLSQHLGLRVCKAKNARIV